MDSVTVGFIGFGEVASIFSKPIKEAGARVFAYDVLLNREDGRGVLQSRDQVGGTHFCTLPDLIERADTILSTVTTNMAISVAEECAVLLKSGKCYIDLNSTSPEVKVKIAELIQPTGADFVEGAILGAVGVTGAKTRILTAGEKGKDTARILSELGLNISYYGPNIGQASMFKMLRSIFSKGLEALMLEMLIAGKRAGIQEELFKEVNQFMTTHPFEQIVSNWVQTHAVAHERRGQEMAQVAETMGGLGLDPLMTSATEAFFRRSQTMGFPEVFSEKPSSMQEVLDFMERQLGNEH